MEANVNNGMIQDLLREQRALKGLNQFLVKTYCNEIRKVDSYFRGYIRIMIETGVLKQACERFKDDYYVKDAQLLKAIYEHVVQTDLQAIKMYMNQISRQIQAAGYPVSDWNFQTPQPFEGSEPPSKARTHSGNSQDYEVQIDAICDLMDFLVDQHANLGRSIMSYRNYCNAMIQNGVPRQIVDHFRPLAQKDVDLVRHEMQQLKEDYPYLGKLYQVIVESQEQLGHSVSRKPKSMN